MKIRLDSHDGLPLNKVLCFSVLNILCESVFQIENKYCPQIHINECEYECKYEYEPQRIYRVSIYFLKNF